jgi:hypothetical protein
MFSGSKPERRRGREGGKGERLFTNYLTAKNAENTKKFSRGDAETRR